MTTPEALDLNSLDFEASANDGARLNLHHPITNTPTGAWLQLLGADSDAYRAAVRSLQRGRMKQLSRTRRVVVTPEDVESDALELLVVATTAWGGFATAGQPLTFTADAAKVLYKRHSWIREQAEEFINDRANFLPKSASAS